VLLRLPDGAADTGIARELLSVGMAPSPLSTWFANPSSGSSGLLLGVATAPEPYIASSCRQLFEIIDKHC
jgi:GntR family transcriptional regulator / MocR family aminotransferase